MSLPIAQKLIWVSPNYVSSSIDRAQPHGWSSAWTILALAQVIGMPNHCTYHTFFSHVKARIDVDIIYNYSLLMKYNTWIYRPVKSILTEDEVY